MQKTQADNIISQSRCAMCGRGVYIDPKHGRITCEGCGHRVMLPRDEFNRRVKTALDGPPGR